MKAAVLVVDDEIDNVEALERLFRKSYTVYKATSAKDALPFLNKTDLAVIISDQRMPEMTGVEFLAESIKVTPDAIRILLTGYADIESVISAVNSGHIYRYITKPWDPVDLTNTVQKAVERFEIGQELKVRNAQLERALAELKSLDKAKSEFMILLNHELKTPLTTILSFVELIAESKLDEQQQRCISRITSASKRLQELIQDSLEFVSAETGQTKIHLSRFSSRELTHTLPDFVFDLMKQRGLELQTDVAEFEVQADEKIVRNVLQRVLHNAAKFADAGSHVYFRAKKLDNRSLHFEIENQGPALDTKTIEHIFKPFSLNENILNHSTGTGLGLSICQSQLKLLQSKLVLQSSDNKVIVSFDLAIPD